MTPPAAPDLHGTLSCIDDEREVRLRLSGGTWHLLVTVYQTGERLMAANSFRTVEAALDVYGAWKREQARADEISISQAK